MLLPQEQDAFEVSLLPAKGKAEGKGKGKGKGRGNTGTSKKGRQPTFAADPGSGQGDDQDDILQDYELSDDSEMED